MSIETVWEQFKEEWKRGKSPAMGETTFNELFSTSARVDEALLLLKTSPEAHKSLSQVCNTPFFALEGNYSSRPATIWESLQDEDTVARFILTGRAAIEGIRRRVNALRYVLGFATNKFGRRWVRQNFLHWWRDGQFEEEEQEVFLKSLAEGFVLNANIVHDLGPEAEDILRRLHERGDLRPEHLAGIKPAAIRTVQGAQPGNPLAARVASLMQPVTLALDIQNACLRDGEDSFSGSPDLLGSTLDRGVERLRRIGHPVMDEFAAVIQQMALQTRAHALGLSGRALSFPLIRYLHLRLLLDAPSLSAALPSPEQFLTPDVLLYVLGNDSVSYSPSMRVFRDSERRWRARWAESSGEATSIMFLENSIGLDLSTLARIPETSAETPDFQVQSSTGEPIVFESKGTTSWKVHLEQRKKAINQLYGKQDGKKARTSIWAPKGRAFALCLFAAQNGDARPSLFYAEDPPFPFQDLFKEGWEQRARRSHYAGVLEAAQMPDAADAVLAGREFGQFEGERFTINPEDDRGDFPNRFVGTYLPVPSIARRLRHPDPEAAAKVKVFVGVHDKVFDALRSKQLGALSKPATADASRPPVAGFGRQAWGFLPGLERGSPARGVYSTQSDGSFLAVSLQ
jgi:hypothetical protein